MSLVVIAFSTMLSISGTAAKDASESARPHVSAESSASNGEASTCVPEKHAPVPPVAEADYADARSKLIASGWQPYATHRWQEVSEENGPTQEQWGAGHTEVEGCVASGTVPCTYLFKDVYGNTLRVHAMGEVSQVVNMFEFSCGDP